MKQANPLSSIGNAANGPMHDPIGRPSLAASAVPPTASDAEDEASQLAEFVRRHAPLFVLTGAGCSTDSGIPDYRDREGRWKRAEPIRFQVFVCDEAARRRYWARSYIGWPRVAAARPNVSHLLLAALEESGVLTQLVTQNVDGLHQRAGSRRVLDLHGRLDRVACLDCGAGLTRERVQQMLALANPLCEPQSPDPSAPDGDVLLNDQVQSEFRVPPCPVCAGMLKPAVVFFGENVPKPRVQRAFDRLAESRGVLVVGSSLTVFSGYRFCLEAFKLGLPIALLNLGRTRADALARLKLDMNCAEGLTGALGRLGITTPSRPAGPHPAAKQAPG